MTNSQKIVTSVIREGELSIAQITFIAKLINKVYLITESDFWPHDGSYERTNTALITEYIKNKELIIARIDNEIVGAVHVYPIKESICGFGMLVAAPDKRGLGIGAALMEGIENWSKNNSYKTIQLELLKPINYKHPDKEFLSFWYTKLGYTLISNTSYGNLYPKQAFLLKIPCNFEIFQKNLAN
jgi:GNAT superfamily N-acetyltransferase